MTNPVKPSRPSAQPAEMRPRTTTIKSKSIEKRPKKKKTPRKKKCKTPTRRKSKSQETEILQQQLQKVSQGRYISVRGSLKLGTNKIKIGIQDVTSGAVYKTSFQLDEEAAQTAQDDREQGNRMLRVVVVACEIVPNRDKNGLRKKKGMDCRN